MLRRFLGFLVAALLLCALGVFFYWNPGTVELRFSPTWSVTLPLPLLLLIAFLLGALLIFLLALFREAQWTFAERRRLRAERRREREHEALEAGRRALGAGRADRARAVLRRAPDDTVEAIVARAETSLASHRPEEAIADLEDARLRHPREPRIFSLLGRAREQVGDRPAATAAFEQAVALDPESPRLAAALRDTYGAEGRWREAAKAEERVISLLRDPDDVAREQSRIRGHRLEAALAAGDDETVLQELRLLVAWDPSFLPGSIALGDRLLRMDRPKDAARVWARAAATRSEPALIERIERLYRELDRPARMVSLYRRWLASDPKPLLRLSLARFLLSLGRTDEAEAELEALPPGARQHPTHQALAGEIHRLRGNVELALRSFRNAAERDLELRLPHTCSACGRAEPEWVARCPGCGEWDTLAVRVLDAPIG